MLRNRVMNILLDLTLTREDNLLKKFEEIHNYIYANDGLSPQQVLEEFIKVLFIKIYDENQPTPLFLITEDEWNLHKIGKITNTFSNRINELFLQTKNTYKDIFEEDEKIRLTENTLAFIVHKMQGISFLNSSQDAKGLAFQKILSHHEKDGQGQFFTPEVVIDICTKILQPKPNETIIDPACGSGGFLFSYLKYIEANYNNIDSKNIINHNIFGIDINKSIVCIAKMKLLLEANTENNISCYNSLATISEIESLLKQEEGFDLILTNPPFGGKISNKAVLTHFNLGHKWTKHLSNFYLTRTILSSQSTETLFIERCLTLLKDGGRMAIVLPNGNFENPSLEYLRYFIKLKAKIIAIINLPAETFIPYGTGVKTSLLFLEKDTNNNLKEYPIFFGRITKLGYQGNKNGTPIYLKNDFGQIIKSTEGQPILDEDYSAIIESFQRFKNKENITATNAFSVSFNELNGRFDYAFYAPENRKILQQLNNSNAVRLGDICDIVKIKSSKLKYPNQLVEYVELSDINTHSYEIINSTTYTIHELPSRASYEIKNEDIITAVAGNSIGTKKHATALVTDEYEGSICTNGFRVLRNFKIDKFYLLYFLKSDIFLKQIYMYRTGAAIPNVSDTDLANILIYLPDKNIINEISKKMQLAFQLRNESKLQIESISL